MVDGASVQADGDSNIGSIKKFNRTNFQIWKFQMTIIFHAKELMGIVEGSETLEVVITEREWKKYVHQLTKST
jgi:hypothetical protein